MPYLNTPSGQYQVLNVSAGSIVINVTGFKASACNSNDMGHRLFSLPQEGPFWVSQSNVFAVVGCSATGTYYSPDQFTAGWCSAGCSEVRAPSYCNGVSCCQSNLFGNPKSVNISVGFSSGSSNGTCVYSTILEPSTFSPSTDSYGLRIAWTSAKQNCSEGRRTGALDCSENAACVDVEGTGGSVCACYDGFDGDGYLAGLGCTDINECEAAQLNDCLSPPIGMCTNIPGSYNCSCAKGHGDGRNSCTDTSDNMLTTAGIAAFSFVLGLLVASAMALAITAQKQRSTKKKNFYRNGGQRLQLLQRRCQKPRLFREKELCRATNNFSTSNRVGKGACGEVYRGILRDGLAVAVKKCNQVSEVYITQFVNEIINLSQIQQPNIVRLVGCCLETEHPLLVYEYLPNGTLYDHLHRRRPEQPPYTWHARVSTALDTATALNYLHTRDPMPIVHRDVKSSNILLDAACSARLADFGVSQLMSKSNSHQTTLVKGTVGYLDPHYFATVQLRPASDVYSFGVVLAELLTGLKAICMDRPSELRNLAALFLRRQKDGTFGDIMDPYLLHLAQRDPRLLRGVNQMASLAKACLCSKAKLRPPMKDIVDELLWIRSSSSSANSTASSRMYTPALHRRCQEDEDDEECLKDPYLHSVLGSAPLASVRGRSSSQDEYLVPGTHTVRCIGR